MPIELESSHRVALILWGNLGDLLLLEPVIRYCSEHGVKPDLYCTSETACVWEGDARLNRIIRVRSSNRRYSDSCDVDKPDSTTLYDYLFDFWPTGRTAKLVWRLKARHKRAWKGYKFSRWLLRSVLYHRCPEFPGLNIRRARVYLDLLELDSSTSQALVPARLQVPHGELEKFRTEREAFGAGSEIIVMQPTARWLRKLWTIEKWRELIGSVGGGRRIILVSGLIPAEYQFPGTLAWRDLVCGLACAEAFVGLDSAPYHVAAMLGIPLVVMFGPTNEREWGPVLPRQRVVKSPLVDGIHATAAISVEAVKQAMDEVLGED
jgi:ADP-heptose:LPS heptosyltransferase